MHCKICSNADGNRNNQVREMMFGYREYLERAKCECLQIVEILPADIF